MAPSKWGQVPDPCTRVTCASHSSRAAIVRSGEADREGGESGVFDRAVVDARSVELLMARARIASWRL
jgi:hypothetical protein